MMWNHRTTVGHTTSIENTQKNVGGKGLFSVDNKISKRIINAASEKFPFEMSLGLDARKIKVEFFPNGTIANGRRFNKPTYLIKNSLIDEVTICEEGRDRATHLRLTNSKLSKSELRTIKNSAVKTDPLPLEKGKKVGTKQPKLPLERPESVPKKRKITNSLTASDVRTELASIMRIQNKYPEHSATIAEGLEKGWNKAKILNAIKVRRLENQLPPPVKVGRGAGSTQEVEARLVKTLCTNPEETLERVYGERVRDRICNTPDMGIMELLVLCARAAGDNSFNGHSDAGRLMNFVGRYNRALLSGTVRLNNASGFSTIDMPNMLTRVTKIVFEESWKIGGFFAKDMCYKVSMPNFKKTQRIRPSGGEPWQGLDNQGRIKHTSFGEEKAYETTLDTKAQMLMIDRVTAKNDDFGAVREMLNLMMEGAQMVPDIKLVRLLWQALGPFFTAYAAATDGTEGTGNDISGAGATLNQTNLEAAFDLASERQTKKGNVNWIDKIADNWTIVVGTNALERTASDLMNQKEYVSNTAANTLQTKDNRLYKKFGIKKYPQMVNKTIAAAAQRDAWLLWPSDKTYAPFSISWLDGVESPTVETVDAPVDMLGFGVRGYLDCDINNREPETIVRARPTGSV